MLFKQVRDRDVLSFSEEMWVRFSIVSSNWLAPKVDPPAVKPQLRISAGSAYILFPLRYMVVPFWFTKMESWNLFAHTRWLQ